MANKNYHRKIPTWFTLQQKKEEKLSHKYLDNHEYVHKNHLYQDISNGVWAWTIEVNSTLLKKTTKKRKDVQSQEKEAKQVVQELVVEYLLGTVG